MTTVEQQIQFQAQVVGWLRAAGISVTDQSSEWIDAKLMSLTFTVCASDTDKIVAWIPMDDGAWELDYEYAPTAAGALEMATELKGLFA